MFISVHWAVKRTFQHFRTMQTSLLQPFGAKSSYEICLAYGVDHFLWAMF